MTVLTLWNKPIKNGLGFVAIAATIFTGVLLGYFVGTAKAFFLIFTAMAVWSFTGWLFGGSRSVLAGLAALAAALTASDGSYALTALFLFAAILVLVADVVPRDEISRKSTA